MNRILLTLLLHASFFLQAQEVRIGIGTTTPLAPLDLGSVAGNRMIFWGEGNQTHYGIGSQNGNMQIYANLAVDNVGFGLGRSEAFSEVFHIKGNGMVGVYNNNPAYRLDINGRIKLSGVDTIVMLYDPYWKRDMPTSVQNPNFIAFNNSNNTTAVAKIGTSNYIEPGSFGASGTFFGIHSNANIPMLAMLERTDFIGNTTFSLAINGSFGSPGQILRSRGLNSSAGWTNPILKDLHNGMVNAFGGNMTLTNQLQFDRLDKVEYYEALESDPYHNSYELLTPSKLLVKIRVSATNINGGCALCGPSVFDVVLLDNDIVVRTFRYSLPQESNNVHETATAILDLPIGWHRLKLGGYMVSGPTVVLGNAITAPYNTYTTDGLRMSVEVIPSYK